MRRQAPGQRLGLGLEALGEQVAVDQPLDRASGEGLERAADQASRPARSSSTAGALSGAIAGAAAGGPDAAAMRARSRAVGAWPSGQVTEARERIARSSSRRAVKRSRTSSTKNERTAGWPSSSELR